MKKFLLVLIALGTTFSLTGCFGDEKEVVVPQEEEEVIKPFLSNLGGTVDKNDLGEYIATIKYELTRSKDVNKISLIVDRFSSSDHQIINEIEIPELGIESEIKIDNLTKGKTHFFYFKYEYNIDGEEKIKATLEKSLYVPKEEINITEEYSITDIGMNSVKLEYELDDIHNSLVRTKIELKNLLTDKINIFEIDSSSNINHKIDGYSIVWNMYKNLEIKNINSFTDYEIKVSLIYKLSHDSDDVEMEVFNDTFKTKVGTPYGILNTNTSTIYEIEKIGNNVPEFQYSYSDRGSIVDKVDYTLMEVDNNWRTIESTRELTVLVDEPEAHEKINTLRLGGVEKGKKYWLLIDIMYDELLIPGSDGYRAYILKIEIV